MSHIDVWGYCEKCKSYHSQGMKCPLPSYGQSTGSTQLFSNMQTYVAYKTPSSVYPKYCPHCAREGKKYFHP